MKKIDLNCDIGELTPGKKSNYDEEIMPYISSCNIACGFHSGNPGLIEKTIQLAILNQVSIGAHPSYKDRKNFGRLSLQVDRDELMADLRYQICALKSMTESFGAILHHVKPHGALYNDMVQDQDLAKDFIQLVKQIDPNLKIYALANSQVIELCEKHNIKGIRAFSKESFRKQLEIPGAILFRAIYENKTVGMHIWYEQGDLAYGHLGSYTNEGYKLFVAYAIFWYLIEHFKERGLRYLDFGGGAGE